MAKMWGDKRVSGFSGLLGAAKVQSAPGADNLRFTYTPLR